jgi:hypothetical protein
MVSNPSQSTNTTIMKPAMAAAMAIVILPGEIPETIYEDSLPLSRDGLPRNDLDRFRFRPYIAGILSFGGKTI